MRPPPATLHRLATLLREEHVGGRLGRASLIVERISNNPEGSEPPRVAPPLNTSIPRHETEHSRHFFPVAAFPRSRALDLQATRRIRQGRAQQRAQTVSGTGDSDSGRRQRWACSCPEWAMVLW
jgi:hypothetical protein